jgi:hypothetical protein
VVPKLLELIRACDQSYFITLTTKRLLDSIALSVEVSKTLHRSNGRLLGGAYRREATRLITYAVQEESIEHGLHEHLLVGVPDGALGLKALPCSTSVDRVITDIWISRDDRGVRSADAQDAQAIYDFGGAVKYVTKTIRSLEDVDHVDLHNCRLPITRNPNW